MLIVIYQFNSITDIHKLLDRIRPQTTDFLSFFIFIDLGLRKKDGEIRQDAVTWLLFHYETT